MLVQAPKKAKKRAEGANSNVFSMFEQAQIQEFKEVHTKLSFDSNCYDNCLYHDSFTVILSSEIPVCDFNMSVLIIAGE